MKGGGWSKSEESGGFIKEKEGGEEFTTIFPPT